jgi:CelD/BcsL family acetyltransferase involved in cellulose biosynthesis
MQDWKFNWIEGYERIFSVEFLARWQALVDQSPVANIFQEPVMVQAWLATKAAAMGRTPIFCWGSNLEGHQALVLFCQIPAGWRNMWQRQLVGVGQPYFDYQDPVAAAPRGQTIDWTAFWDCLAEELEWQGFEQARLPRLRPDVCPAAGRISDAGLSPYISLAGSGDLEEFLRHRSPRRVSRIRRMTRRLEKRGKLDLVMYSPGEQTAAFSELQRMCGEYERLWEGTPSADFFRQPGTMAFYQRLLEWALPRGLVRFSVLRLAGRPISWNFSFFHRNIFHAYTITYDREFAGHSPGKIHLIRLIDLGLRSGWKEIDLGQGDEEYKFDWTDTARPLTEWKWLTANRRRQFYQWMRHVARPIREALHPTYAKSGSKAPPLPSGEGRGEGELRRS